MHILNVCIKNPVEMQDFKKKKKVINISDASRLLGNETEQSNGGITSHQCGILDSMLAFCKQKMRAV